MVFVHRFIGHIKITNEGSESLHQTLKRRHKDLLTLYRPEIDADFYGMLDSSTFRCFLKKRAREDDAPAPATSTAADTTIASDIAPVTATAIAPATATDIDTDTSPATATATNTDTFTTTESSISAAMTLISNPVATHPVTSNVRKRMCFISFI